MPDHDVTLRRRSVALAGHRGDARTARAGLDDPHPAVRAAALGALLRSGGLTARDVREALCDGDRRVRARAAEVASGVGEPALARDVAALLDDPRDPVVEAACFGLGELGATVGGGELEALCRVALGHGDALCREAAVAALGAIGDPAGLEAVLAATSDRPAVRRRAVLALAAFEGPEVDRALEAARGDRDWQVRQAAEDLTGRRPRGGPGATS